VIGLVKHIHVRDAFTDPERPVQGKGQALVAAADLALRIPVSASSERGMHSAAGSTSGGLSGMNSALPFHGWVAVGKN
jgi:hypothetical protein